MSNKLTALKSSLENTLKDDNKPWTRLFAAVEQKTGVDRVYVFLGAVTVLTIYLVVGIGQQLVCNIFGFVYPAYCSMKALESPKKTDDTKWLTYWVVFAVFTVVEFFADLIVFWFPLYWLVKCLLYVWLMAPIQNNGSVILYERFIRPFFLRHQSRLDNLMSTARDATIKLASDALLTEKQD